VSADFTYISYFFTPNVNCVNVQSQYIKLSTYIKQYPPLWKPPGGECLTG